jgi:hypothetical protein
MMPRWYSSIAQAMAPPVLAESRPRSLRMLFSRSTCSGSRDADVGAELADGDVLRPVALVILVELAVAVDARCRSARDAVLDLGLRLVVAGVAGQPLERVGAPAALARRG